jgi:putative endonuclease
MFVYILRSLKDGGLYVGISRDVEGRIKEHNRGKTYSTRNRRPFELVYKEEQIDLKTARDREKYLKSYKGAKKKEKLVENK